MHVEVHLGPHGWRRLKWVARLFVILLVVWGVERATRRALVEFETQSRNLDAELEQLDASAVEAEQAGKADEAARLRAERESLAATRLTWQALRPDWLVAAGGLYLLGLAPSWLLWHLTMERMWQRPTWGRSAAAYYVGHLGKYVPGKALVVILRAALVRGVGVDGVIAGAAVFVETLTTMAAGAALSAFLLVFVARGSWLVWLAFLLAILAAIPTYPPVFRLLLMMFAVRRASPQVLAAASGLTNRVIRQGWLLTGAGWIVVGLSLMAVMRAMPGVVPRWEDAPLLIACVALAMVAGFLSLIPGGLGIRELVVTELLSGVYGTAAALMAAVLLRLVWLAAELIASGALWWLFARRSLATELSEPIE